MSSLNPIVDASPSFSQSGTEQSLTDSLAWSRSTAGISGMSDGCFTRRSIKGSTASGGGLTALPPTVPLNGTIRVFGSSSSTGQEMASVSRGGDAASPTADLPSPPYASSSSSSPLLGGGCRTLSERESATNRLAGWAVHGVDGLPLPHHNHEGHHHQDQEQQQQNEQAQASHGNSPSTCRPSQEKEGEGLEGWAPHSVTCRATAASAVTELYPHLEPHDDHPTTSRDGGRPSPHPPPLPLASQRPSSAITTPSMRNYSLVQESSSPPVSTALQNLPSCEAMDKDAIESEKTVTTTTRMQSCISSSIGCSSARPASAASTPPPPRSGANQERSVENANPHVPCNATGKEEKERELNAVRGVGNGQSEINTPSDKSSNATRNSTPEYSDVLRRLSAGAGSKVELAALPGKGLGDGGGGVSVSPSTAATPVSAHTATVPPLTHGTVNSDPSPSSSVSALLLERRESVSEGIHQKDNWIKDRLREKEEQLESLTRQLAEKDNLLLKVTKERDALAKKVQELNQPNTPRWQRLKEAQEGLLWLITTSRTPDPAGVQYCVSSGGDVNYIVPVLNLPIFFHFIRSGNVKCLRACLMSSNRIDFTLSDPSDGCTALQEAVRYASRNTADAMLKAIVERLAARGEFDAVDWEQRDDGGRDVFSWAAHYQRLALLWSHVKQLRFMQERQEPIPLYLSVHKADWEELGPEGQVKFWVQEVAEGGVEK